MGKLEYNRRTWPMGLTI
uniref:Uncharacterized protein n=1 Tax=Rhizophora mucronata TaxID=61149 RepID=A0A2P2NFX7_RHIMU